LQEKETEDAQSIDDRILSEKTSNPVLSKQRMPLRTGLGGEA